jgi:proteasome accessory factor A
MDERLLGVETEYALSGPLPLPTLLLELMRVARERLVHLPAGRPADLFLANGGRLYVDAGGHPEFCTPECSDPGEAVRHTLAGDRIVQDLVAKLAEQRPQTRGATVFKSNVDYLSGATWACHESYLVRHEPRFFEPDLVPHLVTRIVYAGAGGFHPAGGSLVFSLSPRAHFLRHVSSAESTRDRGIFHVKNESLARRGFHRLHVLCGESLCSETAQWLKLGATALVAVMIEAGVGPGARAHVRAPLAALRAVASDSTCSTPLERVEGASLSAVGIQRLYLEAAEEHLGRPWMPAWAPPLCRAWRDVLDGLERDPRELQTVLDWPLKRALFQRHLERRGLAWETLAGWDPVIHTINRALAASPARPGQARVEVVLGPETPIRGTLDTLEPEIRERGLSWDQLRPVVDLRKQLFELDARFGQLDEHGLFQTLERDGLLAHRVPAVGDVERAREEAPRIGRARLRGDAVRAHAGRVNYRCGWDGVWDLDGQRIMSLRNPLATEAKWKKYPGQSWMTALVGAED